LVPEPIFIFGDPEKLGVVAAVDTSHVIVDVDNPALLTRVVIGGLVAIAGVAANDHLIAVIERVTRSVGEGITPIEEDLAAAEPDDADRPIDRLRCTLIGTFYAKRGGKDNVFKRGADSFPQIDRTCHFIEGGNLQRLMGLLGQDLAAEERLVLGTFLNDANAEAVASGDKLFQRHAAVLGSTGSGKSWAVALLLERAAKLKHANIIVFDLHGEYAPLGDPATGCARRFRIAGPGDLEKPTEDALFLPYWLLNRDQMLAMLLDRSDQNAPNQASRFTHHVRQLKLDKLMAEKQAEVAKTFTVDSPVPYCLKKLMDQLNADNTEKGIGARGPVKGEWEDKLTRFISRLEVKLDDRRYGFMFQPPPETETYAWLAGRIAELLCADDAHKGIKIIDFSEVPADVLPVVTGVFAKLLYDVQFWMEPDKRTPVALFCDEAHLYLPTRDDADAVQKAALGSFERIAKEGRKYGFSLVVISQRPADVSKTILSQCNNFLVLRLTNETDQSVVRRLMPDALAGMVDVLPLLDVGEALLLGDAILLPSRLRLDRPSPHNQPISATKEFWREWRERKPDAAAIAAAVEALRRQTRG
jgi:hypothetical protein